MKLNGPSIAIGATVAAVLTVAVFLAADSAMSGGGQELEPAVGSQEATLAALLENTSPILGNPDAGVTLVEFGDYQCHFCNRFFHDTEHELVEKYVETGKVRMVFKDLTIIGPDSVNAAHGAHCAEEQDMFWEYHDVLYSNWAGENNGWAGQENLKKFALQIGLDTGTWEQCMRDSRYQDMILASNSDAEALGQSSTPAFFVIGPDNTVTKIVGAQPIGAFERVLDRELAK